MLFCPSNDGSRGHSFVSVGGRGHRYLMRCVAVYNHKRSSQHTDSTTELHGGVCLFDALPAPSLSFHDTKYFPHPRRDTTTNWVSEKIMVVPVTRPNPSWSRFLSLSIARSFVRSCIYLFPRPSALQKVLSSWQH